MVYTGRFRNIDDDTFLNAINTSIYMVDILEKLGYSRNSGTMTNKIKYRANNLGISLQHIVGNKINRGGGSKVKYKLSEILIENSKYKNINSLRKRIIKEGIKENKCEICGNNGIWNGLNLTLQLHHINGNNKDNRIMNLQILCPNCHFQTDTHGSRNKFYKSAP